MRALILGLLVVLSGCKTVEFALVYPAVGLRVMAKMEGQDQPPAEHVEVATSVATRKFSAPSVFTETDTLVK